MGVSFKGGGWMNVTDCARREVSLALLNRNEAYRTLHAHVSIDGGKDSEHLWWQVCRVENGRKVIAMSDAIAEGSGEGVGNRP